MEELVKDAAIDPAVEAENKRLVDEFKAKMKVGAVRRRPARARAPRQCRPQSLTSSLLAPLPLQQQPPNYRRAVEARGDTPPSDCLLDTNCD